jgi:hypothetical protein
MFSRGFSFENIGFRKFVTIICERKTNELQEGIFTILVGLRTVEILVLKLDQNSIYN